MVFYYLVVMSLWCAQTIFGSKTQTPSKRYPSCQYTSSLCSKHFELFLFPIHSLGWLREYVEEVDRKVQIIKIKSWNSILMVWQGFKGHWVNTTMGPVLHYLYKSCQSVVYKFTFRKVAIYIFPLYTAVDRSPPKGG